MIRNMKKIAKQRPKLIIVALFTIWRLGLFLLAFLLQQQTALVSQLQSSNWLFLQNLEQFLPYQPSFPYAQAKLASSGLPQWLYSFANFDGVHYLTIARSGYVGTGLIQAFFPVYPLLIAGVSSALGLVIDVCGAIVSSTTLSSLSFVNFSSSALLIIVGLFISNFCFLASLLVGHRLVQRLFNLRTAWHWLFVMLTFPTSFFFGALYTESLFLLLILLSLTYMQRQKNFISMLLSGLSSGVRLVGLFLSPSLLNLAAKQQLKCGGSSKQGAKIEAGARLLQTWRSLRSFLTQSPLTWLRYLNSHLPWLLLGSSGLLFFMGFLWIQFNDPLYFFHVQAEFGAGRAETIVLLPQTIYRYLKILLTVRPIDWKYFSYVQDLVLSLGSLTVLLLWARARLTAQQPAYLCFAFAAWLLPTLTGTFSSMPRYILVIFPIFFYLAHKLAQAKPGWRWLYYGFSLLLLGLNTALFLQGYWVS